MKYIVIFITCANGPEAKRISDSLVKQKLVACVNIISGVKSVFWWKNKIDSAQELLLVAKSKKTKLAKIVSCVKKLHSYTVPEIIALPLLGGNKDYLEWLDESLG